MDSLKSLATSPKSFRTAWEVQPWALHTKPQENKIGQDTPPLGLSPLAQDAPSEMPPWPKHGHIIRSKPHMANGLKSKKSFEAAFAK